MAARYIITSTCLHPFKSKHLLLFIYWLLPTRLHLNFTDGMAAAVARENTTVELKQRLIYPELSIHMCWPTTPESNSMDGWMDGRYGWYRDKVRFQTKLRELSELGKWEEEAWKSFGESQQQQCVGLAPAGIAKIPSQKGRFTTCPQKLMTRPHTPLHITCIAYFAGHIWTPLYAYKFEVGYVTYGTRERNG